MKKWTLIGLIVVLSAIMMMGCTQEETEKTPNDSQADQQSEEGGADDGSVQPESESVEKTTLRIGVPAGVTAMSLLGAMDNPETDHLYLEFDILPTPDLIAAKLINNEVDAMILPTNLAAILYNKGVEYELASANIWGTLYMVTTDDIQGWSDLKGKEIYTIGRGLTPDVTLRYLLEANGLDPEKDVTITYLSGATELAPTFLSGRSTISIMPEPMLSTVLMKKPEAQVILDFQDEWGIATGSGNSYPQASVMISKKLVEENQQAALELMEAIEVSNEWINNNPSEAGEAAQRLEIGLSKEIVEAAVERSNIEFKSASEAKEDIEAYLSILMDASDKLIGGKMPDENFYFTK